MKQAVLADRTDVTGAADKLLALSGIKWWRQLDFAEEKGLGSRAYVLSKSPRPQYPVPEPRV